MSEDSVTTTVEQAISAFGMFQRRRLGWRSSFEATRT
jgi:hypothetical protein